LAWQDDFRNTDEDGDNPQPVVIECSGQSHGSAGFVGGLHFVHDGGVLAMQETEQNQQSRDASARIAQQKILVALDSQSDLRAGTRHPKHEVELAQGKQGATWQTADVRHSHGSGSAHFKIIQNYEIAKVNWCALGRPSKPGLRS